MSDRIQNVNQLHLGDWIYYTGDVANHEWWGQIVDLDGATQSVKLDYLAPEGAYERQTSVIGVHSIGTVYQGHCNPRFVTSAAYKTYQAVQRLKLEEAIGKAPDHPEPMAHFGREYNRPICGKTLIEGQDIITSDIVLLADGQGTRRCSDCCTMVARVANYGMGYPHKLPKAIRKLGDRIRFS